MNEKLMNYSVQMGDKYPVSVVTPVHNVDMELLNKCFESLKAQTIGFENLEWIMVIHNCKAGYIDKVRKMVEGYNNVQVLELNNERHTPSSPRNYGLNFIHGTYVGFLDGDDTYTPACCERVAGYMADNSAQVAVFRMETDSDDPMRLAVRQFLFVDQTQEVVLLEKGKWDSKNYIYGAALNVTSKMYDIHYLDDINLRFDEDVTFAEDNMFNLTAFGKAERICILPQFIGYRYWLNDGSMVQTFDKPTEEVIRYAKGFKKVFDSGLSLGLYMNYVICDLLGYQSAIMLASKALTVEDRIEVKNILGDYIRYIEPIKESKLYKKEMTKMVTVMPKMVIAHPKGINRMVKIMKVFGIDIGEAIKSKV